MTRDGLTEENLHDGSVKDISHRSRGRPETKEEFMGSSDHFDPAFFYQTADLCYPRTFLFFLIQTAYPDMDDADLFTDQPICLFQNPLIFSRFFCIGFFASVACHHSCQNRIFRIAGKKISSFPKCRQTSCPGTHIIGIKACQNPDLFHLFPSMHPASQPES